MKTHLSFSLRVYIIEKPLRRFLQDEFLRQFMIRFALCHIILNAHIAFVEPKVTLWYSNSAILSCCSSKRCS